jgi:hypothetical protein
VVYEAIQRVWSAWAQARYREDFNAVRGFCLFLGYPRSGHSLVGAMLNAHQHAVIAHELDALALIIRGCSRDELFARILGRAAWFTLRGNRSNYRYQIPNEWQGRFQRLHIIGDKRGGTAVQWIRQQPDLLDRLRVTVKVPLRLVHVVRNPYDNIAAIARWHKLSLDESIEFYFSHCELTGVLERIAGADEVITIRHEDLVADTEHVLSRLCNYLDLTSSPEYVAQCSSVVFARPTEPRRRVEWSRNNSRASRDRLMPFRFWQAIPRPQQMRRARERREQHLRRQTKAS